MDTGNSDAAATLRALQRSSTLEQALEFFDSLPPAYVDQLPGTWLGSSLLSGNPFDGLLEGLGWYGKRFHGPNDADPLMFEGRRGHFCLNPRMLPMSLVLSLGRLSKQRGVQRLVRAALPLLQTRKPAARLRMMEFRGVVTATMIYDALAINDHFRWVDNNTLLGVMDLRDMDRPFMFVLHRKGIWP